jgi:hypothetical protein
MVALSTIRNIGPAFEAELNAAGIMTAEELHTLGADAAYAMLLENGTRPHFIGYYVLHMALQGRPWNDCRGDEKKQLRQRFDDLKAKHFSTDDYAIERILDEIGVVKARRIGVNRDPR